MKTITLQLEEDTLSEVRASLVRKAEELMVRTRALEAQIATLDAAIRGNTQVLAPALGSEGGTLHKAPLSPRLRIKRGSAVTLVSLTLDNAFEPKTAAEIAHHSGVSIASARRALTEMEAAGTAVKHGDKWLAKTILSETNTKEKGAATRHPVVEPLPITPTGDSVEDF